MNASTGGAPWWAFVPFGVVGFVVAWRKPRNPLGWCLVGLAVAGALSEDGSFYAIADYRLRHGTLPLGWVAMLAQPGWAIEIVLIGLAVLIFPDGTLPSPRLRLGAVAVPGHGPGLDGQRLRHHGRRHRPPRHPRGFRRQPAGPGQRRGSPGWWNVLQDVLLVALGLSLLLSLAGQVASYRRSSGERRQQLKWLLGGFAAGLAGVVLALTLGHATGLWGVVGHVAVLAVFAVPVSMGVAILKYRLYDIDRIISRTLAYAIVTGLLVGVYAGLVLLAQQVLRFSSPVAVAASTLAAAALFNPVRRRVQHAGGPPVQPGPLRRRPDGGRLRGPAAGRGGPGRGPRRPGRRGAGRPGTGPPHGVDRAARVSAQRGPRHPRRAPRASSWVTPTISDAAVRAAVTVAARFAISSTEPAVLADGANIVVYLRPVPVVAKVAASTPEVRPRVQDWLQRELDVSAFLVAEGAPVVPPSPELPATTHHGDGHVMSLWRYLPPADPSRALRADEETIGSMLRDLHAVLRELSQGPSGAGPAAGHSRLPGPPADPGQRRMQGRPGRAPTPG